MVCRTASGTPRRNGSAARKTPSANSPRAMRRRRARDLPYLRLLLPYVIARTPVPQESLPELFGLPPKFIQPPVVLYHQVGPPGLLFAGELPRLYPPQRLAVHTPLRRPRPPPPFRHRNRYGVVEGAAAAALEQERYLGDEEVGARGRYAPVGLAAHEGVQDVFEVPQGLRVAEDPVAERPAVDALFAKDGCSETLHNLRYRLPVFGEEVVNDLVGRDGLGTELAEQADEGALTGGEGAGDGDGHRPLLRELLCGDRGYFSSRSRSESASKAPVRKPPPSRLRSGRSLRSSRRGRSLRSSRRGGRSPRSSRSSLFGRRLRESRRRRASTSMMRASTSSPERTISSGVSTWWSASSEMWIRPSTPSATSTKAPKETSLVTRPWICCPTLTRSTISCQGSFLVCLRPSEMRSRSRSTSRTLTSTSSPTSTTSLGWSTCCQESSEMWIRPSIPSRSTKAPKSTRLETVPLTITPSSREVRMRSRSSLRSSSSTARLDRTTLLRLRFNSMTLHSSLWPRNESRFLTRLMSTRLAGRKPRSPMSRIRPPFTTSMTGPSTVRWSL